MSEIQDIELQNLLSEEAARERQAFKRATLYVAVPVVIGLLLVAISVYTVIKLEQKATELKGDSERLEAQINEEQGKLKIIQDQSDAAKDVLEKTKKDLAEAEEKIKVATEKIKKGDSPGALNILAKAPSPMIEKPTPVIGKPTKNPVSRVTGKFNGYTYTGRDKTNITVEIMTTGGTEIRVYYALDKDKHDYFTLDGKVKTKNNFTFTLDKTKHNPSNLWMTIDFYSENGGKCQVTITDNDGSAQTYQVPQVSNEGTETRNFTFFIV